MVISTWNSNITFSTNKALISHQMITTGIAKPGKKQADKIVYKIRYITHAASRIIP